MSSPNVKISNLNKSLAKGYFAKHLADSKLFSSLIMKSGDFERGTVTAITSKDLPLGQDFNSGFGGSLGVCEDWLIQKVLCYLNDTPTGIVLFEDPISLPADQFLATRQHPPFWRYDERIFWPVLGMVDRAAVEETISWVAGMRQIIGFCRTSRDVDANELGPLSEASFRSITSSLCSLITDAFDSEGYVMWDKD